MYRFHVSSEVPLRNVITKYKESENFHVRRKAREFSKSERQNLNRTRIINCHPVGFGVRKTIAKLERKVNVTAVSDESWTE